MRISTFLFLFMLVAYSATLVGLSAADGAGQAQPQPASGAVVLRQIVLADSIPAAQAINFQPDAGYVVVPSNLSFINREELEKRLAAGKNLIVHDKLLVAIAQVVENFFRQNDFPIARVEIPPQNIEDGTLGIFVSLGKFRDITFQGNRWFSEALLRDKLHVERGNVIRLSELDRAVSWTNDNPFRRVRVHIDPIPNTDEANLVIGVQERIPLRLVLSADRGGNETIGKGRYTAGLTYANVWGKDHEASYQFVTTDKPDVYEAHVLSYRIPLDWRHTLQFSGSYSHATPTLGGGYFDQDGESVSGDIRYTIPLRTGQNPIETFTGLSFKRSNNNLEFGSEQVFSSSSDIFQFTTGISAIFRDKKGAWAVGLNLNASPGGITSKNTDRFFEPVRFGAKAAYVYGTLSVQRVQNLPRGWELSSRAILQATSTNLIPSEQLGVGGASIGRGYEDNSYLGDEGIAISNELATPIWRKPLGFLSKTRPPLETRGILFLDAAKVELKDRYSFVDDRKYDPLASVGVGVRATLPMNFSFAADYGWQLINVPEIRDSGHKGHIKLVLAF